MLQEKNLPGKTTIAALQYGKEDEYWLNKFSGDLQKSVFPYDFPGPGMETQREAVVEFELSGSCVGQLKALSKGLDHRLYMILTAGLVALLHKYTGNTDIIIGSPILKQETEGSFINTVLALRNHVHGAVCFKELLLDTVRPTIVEASQYQNFPIEALLYQLNMTFDGKNFPLFDAAVLLENIHEKKKILHVHPKIIFLFSRTGEDFVMISGRVEYNPLFYKRDTVERIVLHFKQLLENVVFNINVPLMEIEIMSEEERERILYDFNDTQKEYPPDKTIHGLFEEQVERTPDLVGIVGPVGHVGLSYRQLNEQSNQLAGVLIERGVLPDNIVAIMMERSVEMIVGLLGILKSGGAYLPIDPGLPHDRIDYMLRDSGASLLINEKFFRGSRGAFFQKSPPGDVNLAYVIYTSGSTGRPKGVMVEHGSIFNTIYWRMQEYKMELGDRALQLFSFVFDGFLTSFFTPLVSGVTVVLLGSEEVKDAACIKETIVSMGITHFICVPSLYRLLMEICTGRELSGLKMVTLAGEQVRPDIIEKSKHLNPLLEICNEYGPTEGSVVATFCRDVRPGGVVTIGKPIANVGVYIIDQYDKLNPPGIPGQLVISGRGLARGYLNNPGLTAERFDQDKKNKSFFRGSRGAVFSKKAPLLLYKTGDLARWLLDGPPAGGATKGIIEFLGRIDHQVKIRGFRVELGEIENRLAGHPGVKEAVVLAQEEEKGDNHLCAFVVSDDKDVVSGLREYLAKELPDYMIPTYFVPLEKIPLSPNGKIDRKALPKPRLNAGENYIAPRNEIERKLVALWAEILGREALPASRLEKSIGIDDNFFQLGGHSLKATILVSKIQREFNVKVPLVDIFKAPILREMAGLIADSGKANAVEAEAIEQKEYYELSYNQKRLWLISQLDTTRSSFNMPGRIELKHPVEEEVIRKTIYKLVQRHESLRTRFGRIHGEPVQYVEKEVEIPFKMLDISLLHDGAKQIEREHLLAREKDVSFDLSTAPLVRFTLIKIADAYYDFIFNMHHIISDGWSMEILKKEFYLYYEGYRNGNEGKPGNSDLQYKDYTAWHNKQLADPLRQEQSRRFWREKLREGVPALELPVTPTGDRDDFTGAGFRCILNKEAKEKLVNLAQNTGSTLFMVMFSLYLVLLSRLANKEDVVCSIISAGREEANLQNIVGFFVNSILFPVKVDWKESFMDFIKRVKTDAVEVFQHQYYPVEGVFKELKMKYPDIPASFNMENFRDESVSAGVDGFKPGHPDDHQDVKFDLEVYVSEYENGLFLHWAYKKSLFSPATIEYIVNLYMELVDCFKDNFHESYASYKSRKKQDGFTRNN